MKLWLWRHARVLCEPGLCYGASDWPACPNESEAAAERFAALPMAGVPVWASPSARTQTLVQALQRRRPDLQVQPPDARLREMDFGRWEGVPWSDIPAAALQAWTADFADHRFGGRESAQDVVDRVDAALAQARTQAALGVPEMVWITHAGVIRALHWRLLGAGTTQPRLRAARDWPEHAPAPGQWVQVSVPL